MNVELTDVSRGGAPLVCTVALSASDEIDVELPGAEGPTSARVVRADRRCLALAFRQDPASLARIDTAMALLSTPSEGALAA